jgi:hypothetical protein
MAVVVALVAAISSSTLAAPLVLDRSGGPTRAIDGALKTLPALDPAALPPTEKRWESPERTARHRAIMDELWQTTLAQMYLAYLTDGSPNPLVPGRGRYVVDQIFAEGQHVGKRLKLIVHLNAALYPREQMTEDMTKRLAIFEGLVISHKIDGEDASNAQMATYALAALILSAPLASQQVAEQFGNLRKFISRRCVGDTCTERVRWAILRDWRGILRGYDPDSHFLSYVSVGGSGLFLYGIIRQQMPGLLRGHDRDEKMLNGRDSLIEQAEY